MPAAMTTPTPQMQRMMPRQYTAPRQPAQRGYRPVRPPYIPPPNNMTPNAHGNPVIHGATNLQSAAATQDLRARTDPTGQTQTASQIAAQATTQAAADKLKGEAVFQQQYENYLRKLKGLPSPATAPPATEVPSTAGETPQSGTSAPTAQPPTIGADANFPSWANGPLDGPKAGGTIDGVDASKWVKDNKDRQAAEPVVAPITPDDPERVAAAMKIGKNSFSDPVTQVPTSIPRAVTVEEGPTDEQLRNRRVNLQVYPPGPNVSVDPKTLLISATPEAKADKAEDDANIAAGKIPAMAKGGRYDGAKKKMAPMARAATGGRPQNLPAPTTPPPAPIPSPQGVNPGSTGQQAVNNVKSAVAATDNDADDPTGQQTPVLAGEAGSELKMNDDGSMEPITKPTVLQGGKPGAIIPHHELLKLKAKFDKKSVKKGKAAMGGRLANPVQGLPSGAPLGGTTSIGAPVVPAPSMDQIRQRQADVNQMANPPIADPRAAVNQWAAGGSPNASVLAAGKARMMPTV